MQRSRVAGLGVHCIPCGQPAGLRECIGEDAVSGKPLTACKFTFGEKKLGLQRYQGFSEGPELGVTKKN
jgi:hypothetical protein